MQIAKQVEERINTHKHKERRKKQVEIGIGEYVSSLDGFSRIAKV